MARRALFLALALAAALAGAAPAEPQRILSLCTSATDAILRLGAGGRLAGIDEYSRIVPGASHLAVLGRGGALSREQVVARGIDLAFVWWYQDEAARLLEELGVPVVKLTCGRAADVPETLRLVGRRIGAEAAAVTLAATLEEQLHRLAARTNSAPTARVYLELYSPFKTSGRDSYLNDLLQFAGASNVAAAATGPVLLSAERLVQADPEVLLYVDGFGSAEALARRGGLAALAAVRAGRIRGIDRYWLVAGAGLPEAVAGLQAAIADTITTREK